MIRRLIYLALLNFLFIIAVQGQIKPASIKRKTTIPFHLTAYNSIVVKAILNGRDTSHLMFHTATSDVTLTSGSLAKLKTVKPGGIVDSVKSWGGSTNSSSFSKNNSMEIQNLQWNDITFWIDENSGQQTDGKFGPNLFENQVVELNFDKNVLTVRKMLPRHIKKYAKYKLRLQNGNLFISAVCQTDKNSFEHTFLIHTGFGGDILLDDDFSKQTNIEQEIKITSEKKLSDAYGNVLTTQRGTLPIFKIGNYQLTNIPVSFFKGAIGRQKISIIGGDVLKRFNWVIDAKREYIYLMPNSLFNTSFSNI